MLLFLITAFFAGILFVAAVELFIVYRWFVTQPIGDPGIIPTCVPVSNPEVRFV